MNDLSFAPVVSSLVLAQAETPSAGAAPAPTGTSTSVKPVGVPGESSAATTSAPGAAGGAGGQPQGQPGGGGLSMFLPLVLVMVFIMVFSVMQNKKERKKREQLMASIGKLDKVMVAGGIIGKVIEMSDTEVVLQLEDGKMRVSRGAIQQVLASSSKPGSITEAKPEGTTANV